MKNKKLKQLKLKIAILEKRWNEIFNLESLYEYLNQKQWNFIPFNKYLVRIIKNFNNNQEIEFIIPKIENFIDYNTRIDDFLKKGLVIIEKRNLEQILDDILKIKKRNGNNRKKKFRTDF